MNVLSDKRFARSTVKALLKSAKAEDLAAQSNAICHKVLQLAEFTRARVVVGYLTCEKLREVDTELITADVLQRGTKLFVPVVADKESNMRMLHLDSLSCVKIVPPYGIQEPVNVYDNDEPRQALMEGDCPDFPDVILLPGLAFDQSGRRLGRGGGYYDKFLSRLSQYALIKQLQPPALVGLAFREQILEQVPVDEHDQRVDWLITPDAIINCNFPGEEASQ